jgi:hypothetical protein
LRAEETGARPSARGSITLIGGFLEDSVIPLRRKCQVAEMIDGELQAPKANGFAWGKFDTSEVVSIGNEGEFQLINHQNIQRKAHCKCPFLACQLSMFYAPTNNRVVKIMHF